MRATPILLALASLVVTEPVPAATGGTITGVVDVIDAQGNAVAIVDAWVYLEEVPRPPHHGRPGKGVTKEIVQRDKEFQPHVVVVPTGATVEFPNRDKGNTEHNVFSPNPYFDLGLWAPDDTDKHPKVFNVAGDHDIYCDRHVKMEAVVKVVDTTFIAEVSTKNGAYSLDGLPDGVYKVVAWIPNSVDVKSEELTVAGGTVKAMTIHLHPGKPKSHKRKDNTDYTIYP